MSTVPMTTGDVSRILDVSPDYVRQLDRSGKLASIRTARGIRLFNAQDVRRLVRERQHRAESKL
jgi:excisionase family DNA binding protein